MKIALYRRIKNDRNGNPRYVVNIITTVPQINEILVTGWKMSNSERGYIVTSYNIEADIQAKIVSDVTCYKL
jgi:hypothetical protein